MVDPFEILGIPPDSTDEAIRQRYLQLVKEYTPEKHPERFAAIREAYDAISDLDTRLSRLLFHDNHHESMAVISEDLECLMLKRRVGLKEMLKRVSPP